MAKQTHTPDELPPGHVRMPVVLTGSMGLALAAGLHGLGFLERANHHLAGLFADNVEAFIPVVSPTVLWTGTAAIAYGTALILLEIPGNWRRIVIWISTMAVIAGWLPVAAIAQAQAPVAAPLVAATWAGLCSIIYAARHHMEADDPPPPTPPAAAPESEDPDATD